LFGPNDEGRKLYQTESHWLMALGQSKKRRKELGLDLVE